MALARYYPDSKLVWVDGNDNAPPPAAAGDYDLRIVIVKRLATPQEFERITHRLRLGSHLLLGDRISIRLFKRLIASGLCGYLLRGVTETHLREAIGEVLAGRTYVDPALRAEWMARQLGQRAESRVVALTKRERQVLRLIVLEHTSDEIASKLFIGRCTVETHRARLLHKLGVRNTAGIVREAMRRELCAV